MKCMLVRPPPPEDPKAQITAATEECGDNIVTFVRKRTEVDEYFELYGGMLSMTDAMTPPGLVQLLFHRYVLAHYRFPSLYIEKIPKARAQAFEVVGEVDLPDGFCKAVRIIALLKRECSRLAAPGPTHFRRNYDQDAMEPVFPEPCGQLMRIVIAATEEVEKKHGDLLRDLNVLPSPHLQDPAP